MFDICEELKRIARVIVAVYSEEFVRFNEIFNEKLSSAGIKMSDVFSISEGNFKSKDKAHEDLFKSFIKMIKDIESFLQSRTWNFYRANELYSGAETISEKINREYLLSSGDNVDEANKVFLVYDFLNVFMDSLKQYLDSHDKILDVSQFVNGVLALRKLVESQPWEHLDSVGSNVTGLFNGYSNFMKSGKEIIEMLNMASSKQDKNERRAILENVRENCKLISSFYPFYYSSFIGSWKKLGQNTYNPKIWKLILSNCKTKMENGVFSYFDEIDSACRKFLSKHDKDVKGERGIGMNWKINFKEDAKDFLSKVSTSYIGLVRSLKSGGFEPLRSNSIIELFESSLNNLSDEFAKL